jgi:hypothetical protein
MGDIISWERFSHEEKRPSMATERDAKAYQSGRDDGVDAANADAPTPESNAGDVLDRAWAAAEDQGALDSQTEREEYFVGWTHGYVNRAEGIEDTAAADRDRAKPDHHASEPV